MPIYCYVCDGCGLTGELTAPVADRNARIRCQRCGQLMRRDIAAEGVKIGVFRAPIHSEALGVLTKEQAEREHREHGFEFDDDQRMIVRSAAEHERICEKLRGEG